MLSFISFSVLTLIFLITTHISICFWTYIPTLLNFTLWSFPTLFTFIPLVLLWFKRLLLLKLSFTLFTVLILIHALIHYSIIIVGFGLFGWWRLLFFILMVQLLIGCWLFCWYTNCLGVSVLIVVVATVSVIIFIIVMVLLLIVLLINVIDILFNLFIRFLFV